jgi:hypothetical protein
LFYLKYFRNVFLSKEIEIVVVLSTLLCLLEWLVVCRRLDPDVHALCSLRVGEDDGDDKSVQTQGLTEDEDKDDSDEDIFLGGSAHTSVTGDTDSEACSQRGEAAAQARSEVLISSVVGVVVLVSGVGIGVRVQY